MKRAQGLLETIVAIGVLMTGLISVMTLVISNLTGAREAAMRYQAVNLAREGIEIIRNVRDTNWLTGDSAWENVDAQAALLIQDPLPAPFQQFSRTVTVSTIAIVALPADASRVVSSTVTWQSGSGERKIELSETLYDWR